jgi:hypothetical protein
MFGDKATSMKRLGDIYAGLIEDFDKSRTDGFVITGKNDRPNCVKCGKEMRLAYSLPPPIRFRQCKRFAATVAARRLFARLAQQT